MRPTYDDKIVTTWTSGSDSGTLPVGTVTKWGIGLPSFSKVVVRDQDGKVVKRSKQNACLGGYSQRVDPDAPATRRTPTTARTTRTPSGR